MKITYFYSLYGKLDEKLYTRIPLGYYVYILNIDGSDVCKIGIALNVFERIKQIKSIIKSIFPFIENSITYNVYISSPLKDDSCRRLLESKLHNIFKGNNLDGEWFKCDFKTAIYNLRENEYDYIDKNNFKYILNLFDDKIYNKKMAIENFENLNYLKSFEELNFLVFIMSNYPEIMNRNKYIEIDLNSSITEKNLVEILENFQKHTESVPGKSTYKKDINKRIKNFISKFEVYKY